MGGLGAFLRERLIVEFTRGHGVEAQVELIFPAEFEARLAQRIVAVLRAGMAFGEVGGVRGDFVSDDAVFDCPSCWAGRGVPWASRSKASRSRTSQSSPRQSRW